MRKFLVSVWQSLFSIFFLYFFFANTLLASGNTAGGGGKSSVQANDGSLSIDFKTKAIKNSRINEFTDVQKEALNYIDLDLLLKDAVMWNDEKVATKVDYTRFSLDKIRSSTSKLLTLSKSQIDSLTINEQKSFYINLYNSLTLQLIRENYPIDSIKQLSSGFPLFRSPWKKRFFYLFGQFSSLDRIEHELVRGNPKLLDPLLHFAFNCASVGCPALLNQAYRVEKLEEQLELATKYFLSDRSRNYFKGETLYVSSIFDWYESDFNSNLRKIGGLKDFFKKYSSSLSNGNQTIEQILKSGVYKIEFLPYDWTLNNKF